MARRLLPDLLVLDLIMPRLDGLGVLEQLHTHRPKKMPRVIVLSGTGQDKIAGMALSLGADYYMLKPFDASVLIKRIRDLMSDRTGGATRADLRRCDQLVTSLLGQIRMPPAINGYQYLREAVNLVSVDISLLRGITNRLYPMLAETFGTTPSCVERSIRHAIATTVSRGHMDALYRFFGDAMKPPRKKPTNGEFIAMLAEYVRAELQ